MPYTPPLLIRPPLRPPGSFRPPGPIRVPPTQPAPIYQPPDLLPPTNLDLKGIVCIYSNAPKWEPKKIRYRYPGENWKEIEGKSYTTQLSNIAGGDYPARWRINQFDYEATVEVTFFRGERCNSLATTTTGIYRNAQNTPIFSGTVTSIQMEAPIICTTGVPNATQLAQTIINYKDLNNINRSFTITLFSTIQALVLPPPQNRNSKRITNRNYRVAFTNLDDPRPPVYKCVFKVFDVFDQEILSITRNVCPEVIVVPERCYFQAENERLVAKIIQTLLDPPLRIEYQGHCATVWKDGIIDLPPYPLQIYKECSDNPNCPPPRIRFDQKCEEKCETCPPGTAVRVLLGSKKIACVDAAGCIKKMIKYIPGCNRYDCICL